MKRIAKIGATLLLGVVVLVSVLVVVLPSRARTRLARTWDVVGVDVPVPWPLEPGEVAELQRDEGLHVDVEAVALARALVRGRHLLAARYGCADCHGADFAGGVIVDAPPMGRWVAPNITVAGVTEGFTAADWDRIVRHGINHDGTSSTMPSSDFAGISDRELSDVIAVITHSPAVERSAGESTLGPLRALLLVTGGIPISAEIIDHEAPRPRLPPKAAVDLEFGRHVALACSGCHGPRFAGGTIPGGDPSWPEAANLTPHESGLAGWTRDDFRRAMREGKSRDGRDISPVMPWRATANMTDTELDALFVYLQSLPALPKGAG